MVERRQLLLDCGFWDLPTRTGLPSDQSVRFSQSGCIWGTGGLLLRKLCVGIGNRSQLAQVRVFGLRTEGFVVAHKLRRRFPLPELKLRALGLIRKRDE
jgi:hypothetical protein